MCIIKVNKWNKNLTVFFQDGNWDCFNSYLAFENTKYEPNGKLIFDNKQQNLREIELPDAIFVCMLLKKCNQSEIHFQLPWSTITEITFINKKQTLKRNVYCKGEKLIKYWNYCPIVPITRIANIKHTVTIGAS